MTNPPPAPPSGPLPAGKPRVVHVYKDVYPPVEGGIERTIHHLARLTSGEFAVSVIAASRSLRGGRRELFPGVWVEEVPCWGRLLSTPLAPGFVTAMRRSGADLFHFHHPNPAGELACLALGSLRPPAVVTYHSDVVRQKSTMRLYAPFQRRFLSAASVILPTSARYMETSAQLATHLARCRPLALGLPPEDYEASPARERLAAEFRERWGRFVLFLGVLRYYKGLHVLIEAARRMPGTVFAVAGEGPMGGELRELAAKAGLFGTGGRPPRIQFLGRVDHETAVALLRSASVFCLPATERSEAFGLCQIEAMLCGLPVVSTRLPTGVPEVNLDGESGLTVEPGDADALAAAIGRLMADESFRRRLGEGARRRALEKFTADRMARETAAIYREVLGLPAPSLNPPAESP